MFSYWQEWQEIYIIKSPQEKIRGFYIHFDSVYLGILKKGVIQPFLHLKYMICFDYSHLKIVFIKLVWKNNFFSVIFCWQMWENFPQNIFQTEKVTRRCQKEKSCQNFLGKTSLQVKSQLHNIFRTFPKELKSNPVIKSAIISVNN